MITNLRIKNLKAWGEQLWEEGIEMAPITLFLGPNSAGKTSLLQAPLILKQTFESPDRTLDINLGGQPADLVDVGTVDSILHRSSKTATELGIGLTMRIGTDDLVHRAEWMKWGSAFSIKRLEISKNGTAYAADRTSKGGYLLTGPRYKAKKQGDQVNGIRKFKPERSLSFSAEALAELGEVGASAQDLSLEILRQVTSISYLGPLRQPPERTTLWSGGDPSDIGKSGALAIHALLASLNRKERQRADKEGGASWLVDKVSPWLARLGVADKLAIERQGRSRHYELLLYRGDRSSNIMDVGFGVSQVLPMLVLSYLAAPGSTIIVEQPELHLHPRAQSGLADLMVEVARERKIQFIVETHSEHLFRHLQTLIAEERVSNNDCRLYFVDRGDEGNAQLTRLEVNEFGRVANWPKAFFGDTLGETAKQTELMIARMTRTGGSTSHG